MRVDVQGGARPGPFLQARDVFTTEFDLERPVKVYVREDPDSRTSTSHPPDHHVLTISRAVATSLLARELTLHEFAHMRRNEEGHVSHHASAAEGLFLAAGGRTVPRERVLHCLQIANHLKDVYADDLAVRVTRTDRLVDFFESSLAETLATRGRAAPRAGAKRVSPRWDPAIATVNAAFAVGLSERHGLVDADHRLYDLSSTIAAEAPDIPFDRFRQLFRTLEPDPDESAYRRTLVDAFSSYLDPTGRAAD